MSEQYRPSDRNNDELEAILREFSTVHGAPAPRIVEEPMPVPAPAPVPVPAPASAPAQPAEPEVIAQEEPTAEPEVISEPVPEPVAIPEEAPVLEDAPVSVPLAETVPAPLAAAVAEKPVLYRSEEPRFDFMPRDKREAAPENAPLSPEEALFNWDFLQTAKEAQEETSSPRREKEKPSREEREKPERLPFSWGRMVAKIGLCVLLPVLCLCLILLGVDAALCLGPSDTVRGVYVNTMMETSALKFLPHIFLSVDEVQAIQNQNTTVETEEQVNTDLIHIDEEKTGETGTDGIEIVEISGGSYRGKIMIVKDPSRVQIASLPLNSLGLETRGKKVSQFVKDAGAIAGINGGGFVDTNGTGRGGCPLGIVIKDGRAWYGAGSGTKYSIVGFDKDHKLVIGKMTGKEALQKGVVDAISFGPTLIVNRERMEITGNGSGLNPRTCIGQRADGAIVLLVIDGRHPDSIGASLEDCVNEMEKAGCVNATNLDGGSSSVMYYNGEIINHCASVYGPRYNPNCIIVK